MRGANAVILGRDPRSSFTTVINAFGVKLMARINSAGVSIELIAAVLLIILLAVNIVNPADGAVRDLGLGAGHALGYFGAFSGGIAGHRVRHVRVRHGQLARRGDRRPAPQRAAGDPARGRSRRSSSAG